MDKEYYIKTILELRETLKTAREALNMLIVKATDDLKEIEKISDDNLLSDAKKQEFKLRWGDKESPSSAIIKLCGMLTKITPLELHLASLDIDKLSAEELKKEAEEAEDTINPDDLEIVTEYVKRRYNLIENPDPSPYSFYSREKIETGDSLTLPD